MSGAEYSLDIPIPLRVFVAWPDKLAQLVEHRLKKLKQSRKLGLIRLPPHELIQRIRGPGYCHILVITPGSFNLFAPEEQRRLASLVNLLVLLPEAVSTDQAASWLSLALAGLAFPVSLDQQTASEFIYHLCDKLVANHSFLTSVDQAWQQSSDANNNPFIYLSRSDEKIWPIIATAQSTTSSTKDPPIPIQPVPVLSSSAVNISQANIGTFVQVSGGEVKLYSSLGTSIRDDSKDKLALKPVQFRLDTAVPDQVHLDRAFELAVAIRRPSSPVLNEDDLKHVRSGDIQVLLSQTEPYIRLRVEVNAPECKTSGSDSHSFRIYPNQDSPIFYFHLTPKKLGKIGVVVTVYQEDDWVGSTRVFTVATKQIVGQVEMEIISHSLSYMKDDKTALFELKIFHLNKQFYVQVLRSDRDQTDPELFHHPYSEQTWETIAKALRSPHGLLSNNWFHPHQRQTLLNEGLLTEYPERQQDQLEASLYEQVGRHLYNALLPASSKARTFFETTLNRAQRENLSLTLRLVFDSNATMMAAYSWELLYNERFLVRSGEVNISRYITFDRALPQFEIKRPLRVLFIAARPIDQNQLPLLAERLAVIEGLDHQLASGQVLFDVLDPPTLAHLVHRLKPGAYHCVHFDGHGTFGYRCPNCKQDHSPLAQQCTTCGYPFQGRAPTGALLFEKEDKFTDYVDTDRLLGVFGRSRVQFVVLSACQSSRVGEKTVFGGAGPSLIQAGIPAVVSMQFPITVDDAIRFARQFYNSFAEGEPIDEAVRRGRQQLGSNNPESWYIPTLYVRNTGGEKRISIHST